VHLSVTLADIDDVVRLFLCLLDFLPGLRMQKKDLPFVLLALGAQYGLQAVSRLLGLAF
jgi:hypothetical protein